MAKQVILSKNATEDRNFKVAFNKSKNNFKTNWTKTSNNFNTNINFGGRPSEDIYYDEVVIYDGGGVEGYGYD